MHRFRRLNTLIVHHSFTLPFRAWNLPFLQILPTAALPFLLQDWLHGFPDTSEHISFFLLFSSSVLPLFSCRFPRGRLSWLVSAFERTLKQHLASYRIVCSTVNVIIFYFLKTVVKRNTVFSLCRNKSLTWLAEIFRCSVAVPDQFVSSCEICSKQFVRGGEINAILCWENIPSCSRERSRQIITKIITLYNCSSYSSSFYRRGLGLQLCNCLCITFRGFCILKIIEIG